MNTEINLIFENTPVIPSVKNNETLELALSSDCGIIFVLYGDILNIADIVHRIKACGKLAFVDVDLIDGFSQKDVIIQFMKKNTEADGIISNKTSVLKAANTENFCTILRFFLIDSFSFDNLNKQIGICHPDLIQILPGCMPKILAWIMTKISLPVIASGLVCEKADVIDALKSGVIAISTTNSDIWNL